jgi:hypothetical protein
MLLIAVLHYNLKFAEEDLESKFVICELGDHQSNLNVQMSVALGIENPKCIGTGSFL